MGRGLAAYDAGIETLTKPMKSAIGVRRLVHLHSAKGESTRLH
jgi:hypothetical protein